MELTRRDALAALAASGVAVGTGAVLGTDVDERALDASPFGQEGTDEKNADEENETFPENKLATLLAVADVVYPSELSGVEEFVRTYTLGRTESAARSAAKTGRGESTREDRPTYRDEMVAALSTLDDYARNWHDTDFRELDTETQESVLDQMTVDTADPDPEGSDPERVRFYVVNELLYALYSSPTGGELVGIENPQGHPGGTNSYRRGPQE